MSRSPTFGSLPVLLLVVLVYLPGLSGPFLFDDWANLHPLRLESFDWESLLAASFSNHSGLLRRPIANASFAINHLLSGFAPFAYKATNLAIHLLTGLALLLLASAITEQSGERNRFRWLPPLVAAIWLLHPLQVSTVLYTVQRMTQLSALFTLLAIYTYLCGRRNLAAPRGLLQLYLGVPLLGLAAVLSKENGALLPLFLLVVEFFLFDRAAEPEGLRRRARWAAGLLILLPLLLGTLAFLYLGGLQAGYDFRPFTLAERLMTEAHALWFYIRLLLLPDLASMSLYHDDFPISRTLDMETLAAIGGLAALLATALHLRRRAPLAGLGIAWFLAGHAMESTVIPLLPVFEHRNYLPSLGLFLAATSAIAYLWKDRAVTSKARRWATLGRVMLVGLLFLMTSLRTQAWSSHDAMFALMELHHPDSVNVQAEHLIDDLTRSDYGSAERRLVRMQELEPDNPSRYLIGIMVHCLQPDRKEPIQVEETLRILDLARLPGDFSRVIDKIAEERLSGGCSKLAPADLLRLLTGFADHPKTEAVIRQRLQVYQARLHQGLADDDQAVVLYERAYRSYPNNPEPLLELAYFALNHDRLDAARGAIDRLHSVEGLDLARLRGDILELEGHYRQAVAERQSGERRP